MCGSKVNSGADIVGKRFTSLDSHVHWIAVNGGLT